jgi:hypothetical protein
MPAEHPLWGEHNANAHSVCGVKGLTVNMPMFAHYLIAQFHNGVIYHVQRPS